MTMTVLRDRYRLATTVADIRVGDRLPGVDRAAVVDVRGGGQGTVIEVEGGAVLTGRPDDVATVLRLGG